MLSGVGRSSSRAGSPWLTDPNYVGPGRQTAEGSEILDENWTRTSFEGPGPDRCLDR